MSSLRVGVRVSWSTSQRGTRRRIVERRTAEFTFAGQRFTASPDTPAFLVESEKSGVRAAHQASALRKRNP